MIRDGIKVVAKQGVPPETDWPYDISQVRAEAAAEGVRRRAEGSGGEL